MTLPASADVVVLGAGFAGLSAAVRLAGAGRRVVVVEQAPRLGGRATSFTDRESGERVDNGQHVLFGCYRHTYEFLRAIGADLDAPLQPRLTLAMADAHGRRSTLSCPRLPAPWHLVAGLLRWTAMPFSDRAGALRLVSLLRRVRRDGAEAVAATVPASLTVEEWLCEQRQPPALRAWLWHPLAIAALNQSPHIAAAAPFVRVLAELFAPDPSASAIGLPAVPLEDLYGPPAARYLEARGGFVVAKTAATIIVDAAGKIGGVRAGDAEVRSPIVISTVPWHAFDRIWDGQPPRAIDAIAANARAMASSPIVTVNLWLDSPASGPAASAIGAPFVGFVGGPMHWAFNRPAIVGGSAGHLSVVASGADDLAGLDNDAITTLAMEQLSRAIPGLRTQTLRRSVVVREHRATFSLAPGGPPRPPAITPLAGFLLAGDWTDTGLPGTIEGAVASGHRAASSVLSL